MQYFIYNKFIDISYLSLYYYIEVNEMSEIITDEVRTIFAENLNSLIDRKAISRRRLASEIGVSDALINFYLTGKRYPRVNVMAKLCDFFGVDLRYMVTDHSSDESSTQTAQEPTSGVMSDILARVKGMTTEELLELRGYISGKFGK